MNKPVRVRFAPSPTGPLHIGGVRTALFNYLFARKHKGAFLLRIEDTDQNRYVEGAEQYIIDSLAWCGLTPDEGVGIGGSYGSYKQSERKEIYQKYIQLLLEKGVAYYAFDTPESLDAKRLEGENMKTPFVYSAATRKEMKNELTMSAEEVKSLLGSGAKYVIRFKMPAVSEIVNMHDEIRGAVACNTKELDDKVLFKSDGLPTYHLANVVDDYLMKISHVIRGEEWLPSLPLHVLLYRAYGWEDAMPKFAHLPLILKPEGKGKLSKRDGDKHGFPVFPLEWHDPKTGEIARGYKEDGYYSEAFINMLVFLGWNSGTEKELFTLEELSNIFTLERVGKSGAKFDPQKALWFNQQYIKHKNDGELTRAFLPILKARGVETLLDVEKIVSLVKDRVTFVQDLWDQSIFFFLAPKEYDEKMVKKHWKEQTTSQMFELVEVLKNITLFTAEQTEADVKNWMEEKQYSMGAIMNAFRLAIVGAGKGPHIFNIIAIIGKEETIKRLKHATSCL